MKNALGKLEESIAKSEVLNYIFGNNDYEFINPLLETPTDLDTIFLQGFNKYVTSEERKNQLSNLITLSLIKLTSSGVGLWWCIFFIHDYHFGYKEGALNFSFNVDEVYQSISKYKEELKVNKSFIGYRFKLGLWEDIENMVKRINAREGLKIII
jgi:hypothetical protein